MNNLLTNQPSDRSQIWFIIIFEHMQRSSRPDVFCKKLVLENLAKLTEKQLCQSLFFNGVAGLAPQLLWKRDSGTGLQLFLKKVTLTGVFNKGNFFYRETPSGNFWKEHIYWMLLFWQCSCLLGWLDQYYDSNRKLNSRNSKLGAISFFLDDWGHWESVIA